MYTACEQICYSILHQSCRKTAALFFARSWWVIDQHPHYYLKFHGQDISCYFCPQPSLASFL